MEALVVEPGDVFDDSELELCSGAPDAVADQLGLEAVDEALRGRVIECIPDRADRGEHAVVVKGLAVIERGVLPEFNGSSQRSPVYGADRSVLVCGA